MSKQFVLPPELADYVRAHSEPLDDVLRDLTADTIELGAVAGMQSAHEVGALLTWLTGLVGARKAIEIGTFTGFSAICIARALPDGGTLLCCDVNEEWTSLARKYWERAGVAGRIELRLAPAADTLRALPEDASIDFAYIDADKGGYLTYAELLHPRLRRGGLVAVDNVLWSGQVADPEVDDDNTVALRKFNDAMVADERWETLMLAIGDGLTLLRKR
jgi:caffeoyl-CoA O-methyltransferase